MHMRYADMIGVRACLPARSVPELRFRIGRSLEYFSREYDPTDEGHELRLGFASVADAQLLIERVLPHIRTLSS